MKGGKLLGENTGPSKLSCYPLNPQEVSYIKEINQILFFTIIIIMTIIISITIIMLKTIRIIIARYG